MLKNFFGKKKYIFECLNMPRHLKKLAGAKVSVFNLKRIDNKTVSFFAFARDDKKIKNEFKNAHMLKEENKTGLVCFFDFLKRNLAIIISFMMCFSCFPVLNFFVWNISVYAFDENVLSSVQSFLVENNVRVGKAKSNYKTNEIKALILERFADIAFVDVEVKGETLLINVREKLYSQTEKINCQPIIAQFDGIVEAVSVESGTALVKEGDVVRAGDILVEAYVRRGEKFIPCEVKAEIKVRNFGLFEEEFCEKNTVFVRSGRKVTKNYFTFFKDFDKIKLEKSDFQNFDVQVVCQDDKVFPIIPLKLTSATFYELEEKESFTDFEQNKEQILNDFRENKIKEIGAENIFSDYLSYEKIEEGKYKITYYVDFLKIY